MQPNEIATQTDDVSLDEDVGEAVLYQPNNDENVEIPEELLDVNEREEQERILANIDGNIDYVPPKIDVSQVVEQIPKMFMNVDETKQNKRCFAAKKELRLHKAMNQFGKQASLDS